MQEDYATEQRCSTAHHVQFQLKQMLLDEGTSATLPEDHATQLVIQVTLFPILFFFPGSLSVVLIIKISHFPFTGHMQDLYCTETS